MNDPVTSRALAGPLYSALFGDAETEALFSDEAEIEAMLKVEAALALVQSRLGVIPLEPALRIHRAIGAARIDPAVLSAEVGTDGVPVPALVAALRRAMGDSEDSQFLHLGATSQDIVDSALALRLKALLAIWYRRLDDLLEALATLAERHAALPMAARTYGQAAVPTSFGAVVTSWGRPLLRSHARLEGLQDDLLKVSLSGAAGTLSAMGEKGPDVRAALAEELGLADPGHSWHSERDGIAAFADWMAGLLGSLGKMGEDLLLLTQSDVAEVSLSGAGGSSTMPQKRNPVGPSVLVALARTGLAGAGAIGGAMLHRQQRDGAAWFTEWLALPPLCLATGRALSLSQELVAGLSPEPDAMAAGLEAQAGTTHAEALSFALSALMPRSEAQAVVKSLAQEALRTGTPLADLVRRDHPGLGAVPMDLGQAPDEARRFAWAVREAAGD